MNETKTIGIFEPVSLPDLGVSSVISKIDTGAFHGSLHATNIEENSVGEKSVLSFYPLGLEELQITTDDYTKSFIKSSNGQAEDRYFVTTKIVLHAKEYLITISLAERSTMKKPMLIGRLFLREHNFVVDVRIGTQYANAVKEFKV